MIELVITLPLWRTRMYGSPFRGVTRSSARVSTGQMQGKSAWSGNRHDVVKSRDALP